MPRSKDNTPREVLTEIESEFKTHRDLQWFRHTRDRMKVATRCSRLEAYQKAAVATREWIELGRPEQEAELTPASVKAEARERIESWDQLVRAVEARTDSSVLSFSWVLGNLHKKPHEIDPNDVPSVATATYLQWAQGNRDTFMDQVGKKLMSQDGDTADARMTDDGRSIPDILNQFGDFYESAAVSPRSEG